MRDHNRRITAMPIRPALLAAATAALFAAAPAYADPITGTAEADHLVGTTGADTLDGLAGDDVLFGDPVAGIGPSRKMERVSVRSNGDEGSKQSVNAAVTPDGRTMLFASDSPEFYPATITPSSLMQVFKKDLVTGEVTLLSIGDGGEPFNKSTDLPAISADGRYAAFRTSASNIPGVDMGSTVYKQLILMNLHSGEYTLVSRRWDTGLPGNNASLDPVFSPDGTMLAFTSFAAGLAPNDTNGYADVFVADLTTSPVRVHRVSVGPFGAQANGGGSGKPVFSPDGRILAFESFASTGLLLGQTDMNQTNTDVFLKTLNPFPNFSSNLNGNVRVANTNEAGVQPANGYSVRPVFSPDGRSIAFISSATQLVQPDSNGSDEDIFIKTFDPAGADTAGPIRIVSRNESGEQGEGWFDSFAFSPDGTKLAITTDASNLNAPDQLFHIVMKDLTAADGRGALTLVSQGTGVGGAAGDGDSSAPIFINHGARLLFSSSATNLVPDDGNGHDDIFIATLAAPTGGADRLDGGAGADLMVGSAGNDTYIVDNVDDQVVEVAGGGVDTVRSSISYELPAHVENLVLTGSAAIEGIGNIKANRITGNGAANLLMGRGGNDVISGGGGRDTLVGGPGADRLRGGQGADTFVYLSAADSRPARSKRDTILDFNARQGDIIDLRAIDANAKRPGNQRFTFIGARPFDGKPGQLRFSGGILEADTTGNGKANFAVKVRVVKGKLTARRIKL
jgi:Tol biopolymer transport system component